MEPGIRQLLKTYAGGVDFLQILMCKEILTNVID